MANLVPFEMATSALCVVVVEFCVVLVRCQSKMMKMMKSQKMMKMMKWSACPVVAIHQFLHDHAGSWSLGVENQTPNLGPLLVVFHCQIHALCLLPSSGATR